MRRDFAVGDRILGRAGDSHPEWCAAYAHSGTYRIIGASAIGKLHRHEGRPRDDAFAVRAADEWVAIAVSDGVGSRKLSRYGATFAVEALGEYLLCEAMGLGGGPPGGQVHKEDPHSDKSSIGVPRENLLRQFMSKAPVSDLSTRLTEQWECEKSLQSFAPPMIFSQFDENEILLNVGTMNWRSMYLPDAVEGDIPAPVTPPPLELCIRRAFSRTREGLEQFGGARGMSVRELHCTLLGTLLNTRTGALAVGQIGDGLIAGIFDGSEAQSLVDPPTAGAANEVYTLSQSDWEQYLAVRELSLEEATHIRTVLLMTDGVSEDCTHPPPENLFQRWTQDIDRELRQEGEMASQTASKVLRWLATYEARGSWDDRTLVAVLRDPFSVGEKVSQPRGDEQPVSLPPCPPGVPKYVP